MRTGSPLRTASPGPGNARRERIIRPEPLYCGQYYHIYNRGNSGERLFREERNYRYFLKLYGQYIEPVAETYAYCLLSNHFHLLVRIREQDQDCQSSKDWQSSGRSVAASRAFSDLFSTYTKAFNKAFQRTGSLFEKPFRRKVVADDRYCTALIAYIHHNPQRHGFVPDYRDWPFSSYAGVLSARPSRLRRAQVLEWFGGQKGFEAFHAGRVDEAAIEPLIAGDWL